MSTRLSCTILFIIAVCERATSDGCIKTQCLENNQFDNDCCGLNHAVGCSGDYLLSFTADNGCIWNRGTCCTKTPKLYTSDCSTSWCSSPNGYGGVDCWAVAIWRNAHVEKVQHEKLDLSYTGPMRTITVIHVARVEKTLVTNVVI